MARVLGFFAVAWAGIEAGLLMQRGHLFSWAPVCFATGIGGYFSLRFEPDLTWLGGAVLFMGLALFVRRWVPLALAPFFLGVALVALGVLFASARAHYVAGPVLDGRYYGAIEGRVLALDQSASGAVRLTLSDVELAGRLAPAPTRVRVALHAKIAGHTPQIGQRVMLTGHLSPPPRAVEPGGFDFRRHAWFQRLGAIGYTRSPVVLLQPGQGPLVSRLRQMFGARIRAALPGDTGAVAVALITGDRSALPEARVEDLRRSNLAHLLAISGLHMGLVSGFVFWLIRILLSCHAWIALRWPIKKLSAGAALFAAAGYLALSGGAIATERAFIMVAMALLAVMLDHRALTLRAVALAALVVLILRPEALVSPGFQMSFAATTSLVVVFSMLRGAAVMRVPVLGGALSLFLSSAVAGLATAPIAAAHFNMVSQLGLIANLTTVPLMGLFVMPAAVLAVFAMPFGMEAMPLWAMGAGIDWILAVAQRVADHPLAVRYVASPVAGVLPVLSFGGLFVCLWRGGARWLGLLPVACAFGIWAQGTRPDILIADQGALVGVMTDAGRALSASRGAGFIAEVWLENDGSPRPQVEAAALWPDRVTIGEGELFATKGKRAAQRIECKTDDWMISDQWLKVALPCRVWDAAALSATGSVAIYDLKTQPFIVTDRAVSGERLWSRWPNVGR
ncbi:ComEC/Rec2 family competence protein [Thalassobius sp. Cn5-15]|uniref:ComEC/Rec2 family competence protein n=1 Tax=Thalassobius sp. Cn5-15 TaxID=2917763 RepID=UPI001EF2DB2F|nr:ComEC/Rec2 family competence protein [Thalassobius sp. Cn5-15]MCG7492247.1 ComEC family competence protein [Thalassobius sp. Cn5-15]